MALAYRNLLFPRKHLPSREEAEILNNQIHEKISDSVADRKHKFRDIISNTNELKKRGVHSIDELNYLIELIEVENDLRETAAYALASLINNSAQ